MINNSISNMGSIRNRKIGGVGGRLAIRKPRTLFFVVVVVAQSFFIQPTRMVYTHVGTFQHTHTHSSCVECRDTPPPKQTNKIRGVFLLPPKRMYQYIYIYIYQMSVSKYVEREKDVSTTTTTTTKPSLCNKNVFSRSRSVLLLWCDVRPCDH